MNRGFAFLLNLLICFPLLCIIYPLSFTEVALMKFGVCTGTENVKLVKEAGFDFIEINFGTLSKMSNEEFETFKNDLNENNLLCFSANCFLPADFMLCSKEQEKEPLKTFIEKGMKRGSEIGMTTIAFGSGKARRIQENQTYEEAFFKLSEFLKEICVPLCEKYNFTIAIEPLRKEESNIINTVKEGALLAYSAKSDKIKALADIFHMVCSCDDFRNIVDLKGTIHHAHISHPVISENENSRIYPLDKSEYDYSAFMDTLKIVDCKTCSIEAHSDDLKTELKKAYKVLKSL